MPPSPLPPGTLRHRRWWRWGVPLLAMLLATALVETGLRLAEARADARLRAFRVEDPHRGFALRPGHADWTSTENVLWMQINSDGLRDREHSLVAPPATVRIAVLGDSYMQASNVPLEKAFVSFLEREFGACLAPAGRRAEVLNFGVSGYGTAQELLTYRHHAVKYRPDIVLLAFYTGNDVFNNHRDLDESPGDGTPYFVLQDGALVRDPRSSPREAGTEDRSQYPGYQRVRLAITDRLLTAALLYQGWGALRARVAPPRAAGPAPALAEDAVYLRPGTPAVAEAWRVTEALLLALAREVAAQGAELWVVTLSNAEQVDPDLTRRRAFAARLGVDSLRYPDLRIRDFARTHAIPVITLVEPLADHAAATGVFLNGGYNEAFPPGTGHWNETANRLAAHWVGARLCAESRVGAGPR